MTENEIEKMIEEEPQPGIQELMKAYGGLEEYICQMEEYLR